MSHTRRQWARVIGVGAVLSLVLAAVAAPVRANAGSVQIESHRGGGGSRSWSSGGDWRRHGGDFGGGHRDFRWGGHGNQWKPWPHHGWGHWGRPHGWSPHGVWWGYAPAPVWVPGQWVWNGWGWVWQSGYWQ